MNVNEVVSAIKKILPARRPIEHHEPFTRYLVEIDRNYHDKFREGLLDIVQANYAVLTNSGTSALHTALLTLGVNRMDHIVVCPSSTFVATANAISYTSARVGLIDGSPDIDLKKLREFLSLDSKVLCPPGNRTSAVVMRNVRAIIVVHLYGHATNVIEVCKVAEEFGIPVIEDASQAIGTTINGRHVGTFGDIGVFSFNNNKLLTTQGGGAVVTNNLKLNNRAFQLATTARVPHPWLIEHDDVGYNYRMGGVNAALGYSQLETFKDTLKYKRDLAQRYRKALRGLVKFIEPVRGEPNYWLNVIDVGEQRDELLEALHKECIRARASFTPMHQLPMYRQREDRDYVEWHPKFIDTAFPQSDRLFMGAVCLPSGANL